MIGKLAAGIAAVFATVEGVRWWRKKHAWTQLIAGHGYTVVLGYSGQGVGGPLSVAEIQSYLDQGSAGVGTLSVSSASTDPNAKTITYLVGALQNVHGDASALAPASWPKAFGSLTVENVHDTGDIGGLTVSMHMSPAG